MKRAFLFGLATQLALVGAFFLFFDDLMLPMTQSPLIGLLALCLGGAAGYFALKAAAHSSWLIKIGMWAAGFLSIYVAIPVMEVVAVMIISFSSE